MDGLLSFFFENDHGWRNFSICCDWQHNHQMFLFSLPKERTTHSLSPFSEINFDGTMPKSQCFIHIADQGKWILSNSPGTCSIFIEFTKNTFQLLWQFLADRSTGTQSKFVLVEKFSNPTSACIRRIMRLYDKLLVKTHN